MRILLETERLLVRELSEADAENVFRLNASPEVTRYVGEPPLTSAAEGLEILRTRILPQYRNHGVGRWAVIVRDGARFIGWCGLKYLPATDEYDLGYRYLEDAWGQGYATEAARAVLAYGVQRLPGKRIVGRAMLANVASLRVLQKLGMRLEGHGREHDGEIAIYVA
jgi:ribosomal-protein-alanine N-acetyltransferase